MTVSTSKRIATLFYSKPKLNKVRYTLKFASIVTPATLKNIRLLQPTAYDKTNSHNKILVKQSYLLLTWLIYVKGAYSSSEIARVPSFFVQPVRQSKLTNLKTPMAHKTFSQEQFLFKKYTLTISFMHTHSSLNNIQNINTSIFIILLLRAETPFFNTNLLFLKRFTVQLSTSDGTFFSLI
jgi:hypothetical protein